MKSFGAMHDDHLDPDLHGVNDEMPIVEDAIAECDLKCPCCGEMSAWYEDKTEPHFTNDLTGVEYVAGWGCPECGWEQEAVEDDYTRLKEWKEKLQPRIGKCLDTIVKHVIPPVVTSIDEFVAGLNCPEGDFSWDDTPEGDSHAMKCGYDDCEAGWHEGYFSINIYRQKGKLSIEVTEGDSDGNAQVVAGWDEGDNLDVLNEALDYTHPDHYFIGWARYYLEIMDTGKDPLESFYRWPDNWTLSCLESAEDMVRYLKMNGGE